MKNNLNDQFSKSISDQQAPVHAEAESSLPLAARVTSHSGSGASYTFQVVGEPNTDQDIVNQWNTVEASGEYLLTSFFQAEFNQGLPPGTNWVLTNAAGVQVGSGNTGRGTVTKLNFYLGYLADGTPALQSQNTFTLNLTRAYTSFSNFTVPNTSGGLVIIANVDGQDDYYDASRITKAAESMQDASQLKR